MQIENTSSLCDLNDLGTVLMLRDCALTWLEDCQGLRGRTGECLASHGEEGEGENSALSEPVPRMPPEGKTKFLPHQSTSKKVIVDLFNQLMLKY